jgi:ATP-dependent helicase Lhr and Lhr-like helicase
MNASSEAFDRLAPGVQRWVYRQGWTELRDIQRLAVSPILEGRDVIISSATATGKTEAAFLPICTAIADEARDHLKAMYIAPLKALINDQERRLVELMESIGASVTPWHGDISSTRKRHLFNVPSGLLLITPESLEALFVLRGSAVAPFFAELDYIVVDELHSFIGQERGRQLQSLLNRVELAANRAIPRIALSATLGDLDMAASFLRPNAGNAVVRIESLAKGEREVQLQIRGYLSTATVPLAEETGDEPEPQRDASLVDAPREMVEHLFRTLYDGKHIVFCNSRANVELFSDSLSRMCETLKMPNHFVPHHGSLSKEIRSEAEALLQSDREMTVLATTTLELGINIGKLDSVGQIGAPPSVASLRQRIGRSGRRPEQPSVMRIYINERPVAATASLHEGLRLELVQAVAMVRLLSTGWIEPPDPFALHLSTLVQQLLSQIAQFGGVTAHHSYHMLCVAGPFNLVDQATFVQLLRDMAANDLIAQTADGTLVFGLSGERIVNFYDFYASFMTPEEWKLITGARVLGTMPIDEPLVAGTFLIFAGRRWKINSVDGERREVDLAPHWGGRAPRFSGAAAGLHERVAKEMFSTLLDAQPRPYVNETGNRLLTEAREAFARLSLDREYVVSDMRNVLLYPWLGHKGLTALKLLLQTTGLEVAASRYGLEIANQTVDRVNSALKRLYAAGPPDPLALASNVANLQTEKHHRHLGKGLLARDFASAHLDVQRAWVSCGEMIGLLPPPAPIVRDY